MASLIKENDLYNYKARLDEIIDADTIKITLDLGCHIYHSTTVRLLGINAAEKKTVKGQNAILWLQAFIPVGHEIKVSTWKDKNDKYGRLLAVITYNGLNINEELVKSGHAVEYDGGKR